MKKCIKQTIYEENTFLFEASASRKIQNIIFTKLQKTENCGQP